MGKQYNSGLALIMVLMILSLVASLTLTLTGFTSKATEETQDWQTHNALYYATLAGESFGMALLTADFENSESNMFLNQAKSLSWELPTGSSSDMFETTVYVEDLQARFNISTLEKGNNEEVVSAARILTRYANELALPVNFSTALIDAIEDNSHASNKGTTVLNLLQKMVNELLQKSVIELEALPVIVQHFTSLPKQTPINFNTAPQALIAAIVPDMNQFDIQSYISTVRDTLADRAPSRSTNLVVSALSQSGMHISPTSQYFVINTTSMMADTQRSLQSVVFRDQSSGTVTLILRRTPEIQRLDGP